MNRIISINLANHLSANSKASIGFIVNMKEIIDIDYKTNTKIIIKRQIEKDYYSNSITKKNYEFLVKCAQYSFLDSKKQNYEKLKN